MDRRLVLGFWREVLGFCSHLEQQEGQLEEEHAAAAAVTRGDAGMRHGGGRTRRREACAEGSARVQKLLGSST